MGIAFQKAIKRDAKLRLGIAGPSGSGKTYTALKLATELARNGKIAVVDTERGSAKKYADLFAFDVIELDSYHPELCTEAIKAAESAGYDVIVIDSLSHFWMGKDGELELVDREAKRSYSGNSFAAWKTVTPLHNKLVDAIIGSTCHVIITLRVKTEWVIEENDKGKKVPRKVGLAPVMREGIEYEADVFGEMNQENELIITKTRCSELARQVYVRPGADVADILKRWLHGAAMPTKSTPAPPMPVPAPPPLPPPPPPKPGKKSAMADDVQISLLETLMLDERVIAHIVPPRNNRPEEPLYLLIKKALDRGVTSEKAKALIDYACKAIPGVL